jgi:hypothetical protein
VAATYVLISSQVLGTSAASVTFSSIPQTYTDLVLRSSARSNYVSSSSDIAKININSDTTIGNYSATYVQGNYTTSSSGRNGGGIGYDSTMLIEGGSNTANTFSSTEWYIPNYTLTGVKQSVDFDVVESAGPGIYTNFIKLNAHYYLGTSAITAITLTGGSGTLSTGSSFYLYGIKNS